MEDKETDRISIKLKCVLISKWEVVREVPLVLLPTVKLKSKLLLTLLKQRCVITLYKEIVLEGIHVHLLTVKAKSLVPLILLKLSYVLTFNRVPV